jgi:hypothetical protein
LIALDWYHKHYFSGHDVFFDTDTVTNLSSVASGWGRNTYTHSFLELFSFPIRCLSLISNATDNSDFRKIIAISISPLFSSLKIFIFYKILENNDFKNKMLITLFYTFSFSNLIFSIIPESYAISSFFIAFAFYYYFECSRKMNSKDSVWFFLACALTGFTITNVFIFFIVYFIFLTSIYAFNKLNAFKKVSLFSVISIGLSVLVQQSIAFIYQAKIGKEGGERGLKGFHRIQLITL